MKKITINFKKFAFYGFGAAVALTPIAIAASCGESGTPTVTTPQIKETYRQKLASEVGKPLFDLTSTNENVKVTLPALNPIAKEYKYLMGNYATLAAVKAAPETAWVSALPTTVDYLHSNRYLWLRVVVKTATEIAALKDVTTDDLTTFENDNKYFDLTSSSKIQDIKSNVDNSDAFKALTNLDRIVLGGSLDAPTINIIGGTTDAPVISDISAVAMPGGTVLKFNINNQWLTSPELINYLKANKATINQATLDALKVRIVLTDANKYILTDAKENKVGSTLIVPGTFTLENLIAQLQNVKADAASVHNQVVWTNAANINIIKPTSVDKIEYYVGSEATIDLVKAATSITWLNALPIAVSETHASRHLYVKFTPVSGETLTTDVLDLTTSSDIQKVRTLITTQTNLDLSMITLSGTIDALTLSLGTFTTPANTTLQFQIKTSGWVDKAAFETYLTTNSATLTSADVTAAKVRLTEVDATLYKLDNTHERVISSSLTTNYIVDPAFKTALGQVKATTTSSSAVVAWDNFASVTTAKPAEIASVSYYYGPLATLSEVSAATNLTWSSSLPTTVSDTHGERHLFAKLTPASGFALSETYIDLTTSSDIQKIRTLITTPGALDLSIISLSGTTETPAINTGTYNPIANTSLQYQFGTSEWLDQTAFITYITTNASTITPADLSNMRVRLVETDSVLYLLDNNHQSALTNTLKISYTIPNSLQLALEGVKAAAASLHNSVTWENFAAIATVIPTEVTSIEYYVGTEANVASVKAANSLAWSSSLPTTVSDVHANRHLYARLNLANGYYLENNIINLTATSNIQLIKTVIDTSGPSQNVSLILASGPESSPVIDISGVVIPANAKLMFQVGVSNNTWRDLAGVLSFIAQFKWAKATLLALQARFEPINPTLFTVSDSRQGVVGGTGIVGSLP